MKSFGEIVSKGYNSNAESSSRADTSQLILIGQIIIAWSGEGSLHRNSQYLSVALYGSVGLYLEKQRCYLEQQFYQIVSCPQQMLSKGLPVGRVVAEGRKLGVPCLGLTSPG